MAKTGKHNKILALIGKLASLGVEEGALIKLVTAIVGEVDGDLSDYLQIIQSTVMRIANGETVAGWEKLGDEYDADFVKWAKEAVRKTAARPMGSVAASGRPEVRIDVHAHDWYRQMIAHLRRDNEGADNPFLYEAEGEPVVLRGLPGELRAERVDTDTGATLLTARTDCIKLNPKSGEPYPAKLPSDDTSRIFKTMKLWPELAALPKLRSVSHLPYFDDGSLIVEGGYNAEKGIYLDPDPKLADLSVPPDPSDEEIKAAVELFDNRLFADVAFDGAASRANAFALFLTPFIRLSLGTDGVPPLILLTKPSPGSGATYVAKMAATLVNGTVPPTHFPPKMDDSAEWDKRICAILQKNPTVVILDNLKEPLGNEALEVLATSGHYGTRLLGTNTDLSLANNAVWVATGNNLRPKKDAIRRCVSIRLDTGMEHPEDRKFRDPDLVGTIIKDRTTFLGAVYTLISAWYARGRLKPKMDPLAGYSAWQDMIGGILYVAGVEGFLDNRNAFREESDAEGNAWAEALKVLQTLHPAGFKIGALLLPVTDMMGNIKGHTLASEDLREALPAEMRNGEGTARYIHHLSKEKTGLPAYVDQPHGGLKLVVINRRAGSPTYRVDPAAPTSPSTPRDASSGEGTSPKRRGCGEVPPTTPSLEAERSERSETLNDTPYAHERKTRSTASITIRSPYAGGQVEKTSPTSPTSPPPLERVAGTLSGTLTNSRGTLSAPTSILARQIAELLDEDEECEEDDLRDEEEMEECCYATSSYDD